MLCLPTTAVAEELVESPLASEPNSVPPPAVVAPPPAVVAPPPAEPPPADESAPIGAYNQPRWSALPRFALTPVYVVPSEFTVFFTQLDATVALDGSGLLRYHSLYGAAVGIGHRLQLDVAILTEQDGNIAPLELRGETLGLRWAPGVWDALPGNPTLMVAIMRPNSIPPKGMLKLLLGASLGPHSQWGVTVGWDRELRGGNLAHTYGLSGAIGITAWDGTLSLSMEAKGEITDRTEQRLTFDTLSLVLGPTLTWRPAPRVAILAAAFGGTRVTREQEISTSVLILQPTCLISWML